MNITASQVNELRQMTGAGMMDCKKALVETDGDIQAAIDILRKKGMAKAAKLPSAPTVTPAKAACCRRLPKTTSTPPSSW